MRLFFLLFLTLVNFSYGIKDTSNFGHSEKEVFILDVIKEEVDKDKFKYILLTPEEDLYIESINEYATLKVAAFLKTKINTKQKITYHYNYYNVNGKYVYMYNIKVCNATK